MSGSVSWAAHQVPKVGRVQKKNGFSLLKNRVFDGEGWNSKRFKIFGARIWWKKENSEIPRRSRDIGSESAKFDRLGTKIKVDL